MSALVMDFRFMDETHVIILVGEGAFVVPAGATRHGVYPTLLEAVEVADSILPLLGATQIGIIFV